MCATNTSAGVFMAVVDLAAGMNQNLPVPVTKKYLPPHCLAMNQLTFVGNKSKTTVLCMDTNP